MVDLARNVSTIFHILQLASRGRESIASSIHTHLVKRARHWWRAKISFNGLFLFLFYETVYTGMDNTQNDENLFFYLF